MQKTLFILLVITILVSSTVFAPARDLKSNMTLSSSNEDNDYPDDQSNQ